MARQKYWHPNYGTLSKRDLNDMDQENQIDIMRTWFFEHYEDPAESTPYESREGGYIYIWGGPYEADLTLREEFEGYVSEQALESLIEELNDLAYEWAPKGGDVDESYYASAVQSNHNFYQTFTDSIDDIRTLMKVETDSEAQQHLWNVLYVSVITALETFLSDAFITTVLADDKAMRRFIESTPEFKKQHIAYADILKYVDQLHDETKKYLLERVIWHQLHKVKPMYQETLHIAFPENLDKVFRAINTRHDLVHRGGKTKQGKLITLTKRDLGELIESVGAFVEHVYMELVKDDEDLF